MLSLVLPLFAAKVIQVVLNATAGFNIAINASSAAGYAACIEGTLRVTVTFYRTKLLLAEPIHQANLTELIAEMLQVTMPPERNASINGGQTNVTDSFSICSKLCRPRGDSTFVDTQTNYYTMLIPSEFWDIVPGYSYIDAAV